MLSNLIYNNCFLPNINLLKSNICYYKCIIISFAIANCRLNPINMNKTTIAAVTFMAILIISLILSWMMTSSESIDETVTDIKPIPNTPISVPKPQPPPPNVYWSEFNRTLLNLEQEHVEILQAINPFNIKQIIVKQKTIVTQQAVKIPTQDINWSAVSENLLELEQKRKDIISLLAVKYPLH